MKSKLRVVQSRLPGFINLEYEDSAKDNVTTARSPGDDAVKNQPDSMRRRPGQPLKVQPSLPVVPSVSPFPLAETL